MKYKTLLKRTAIASALLVMAAPASSQTNTTNDSGNKKLAIEEIIVTAQRREKSLQDTPVSVTVANTDDLAAYNIENITNISSITPSIQFTSTNAAQSSANLTLRGVGTNGNSRTFEGGVGVIVDGVYRTRVGAVLETFLDIGGVQVLRGPQGTLFGKNTTAGAVLLDSITPSVEENKGSFAIGIGTFSAQDVKVGYNFALSDKSALRVTGLYDSTDSFIDTINIDGDFNKETTALKANYLYETDKFKLNLIADVLESDGQCCYESIRIADETGGALGGLVDFLPSLRGLETPSRNLNDFESGINSPSFQEVNDQGVTLKLSWKTDSGTFNSVTALRSFELVQNETDADFGAIDLLILDESFESEFFSQELTYTTDIEAVNGNVIFGAYYSTEDITDQRRVSYGADAQNFFNAILPASFAPFGVPAAAVNASIIAPAGNFAIEDLAAENESFALFAHGEFELSEQLNLIAGVRWSKDDRRGSFTNTFFDLRFGPSFLFPGGFGPREAFSVLGVNPGPEFDESFKDDAFSGMLGLQYQANDNLTTYATVSQGFKSGGISIDGTAAGTIANNPAFGGAAPLDPSFDSETQTTYELGLKASYWNGRAQTNFAAFYNDLEDFQVAAFLGLQFAVFNSAEAESYGAEIENTFLLNEILTLKLDAVWIPEAEYGVDPDLIPSLSGQRFKFAPEFTANASLNIDTPLTANLGLQGRLQYQHRGSQFNGTPILNEADSINLVNLSAGIYSINSSWVLEAWMRNVTDEAYQTVAFPTPLQTGLIDSYVGAPRTYGVNFRTDF